MRLEFWQENLYMYRARYLTHLLYFKQFHDCTGSRFTSIGAIKPKQRLAIKYLRLWNGLSVLAHLSLTIQNESPVRIAPVTSSLEAHLSFASIALNLLWILSGKKLWISDQECWRSRSALKPAQFSPTAVYNRINIRRRQLRLVLFFSFRYDYFFSLILPSFWKVLEKGSGCGVIFH